jgi:hypothetical protein
MLDFFREKTRQDTRWKSLLLGIVGRFAPWARLGVNNPEKRGY